MSLCSASDEPCSSRQSRSSGLTALLLLAAVPDDPVPGGAGVKQDVDRIAVAAVQGGVRTKLCAVASTNRRTSEAAVHAYGDLDVVAELERCLGDPRVVREGGRFRRHADDLEVVDYESV